MGFHPVIITFTVMWAIRGPGSTPPPCGGVQAQVRVELARGSQVLGVKEQQTGPGSLPFLYKFVPDFRKVRMPYNIGVRTPGSNQLHLGEIHTPAEKAKICPRWRHSGMRTFWDFSGLAQLCPKIPTTESGQFTVLGLSLDIGLGSFYGAGDAQKKKIGEKWKK